MIDFEIGYWDSERDSFEDVTELLHRAYETLALRGLNYVAATQGVETTRRRIATATATWVARSGGDIIGVVSYYDRRRYESEPDWYGRQEVAHFGQFGVDPDRQGGSVGSRLLAAVEKCAAENGKTELSCDTAADARSLVEYYQRRGYRSIATHRWPHATYESLVLSKNLATA